MTDAELRQHLDPDTRYKAAMFGGVVLVWLTWILLSACISEARYLWAHSSQSSWKHTTGDLESVRLQASRGKRSGTMVAVNVNYSFNVNGTRYHSDVFQDPPTYYHSIDSAKQSVEAILLEPGLAQWGVPRQGWELISLGQVDVSYNPSNPAYSILVDSNKILEGTDSIVATGMKWAYAFILAVLLLVVLFLDYVFLPDLYANLRKNGFSLPKTDTKVPSRFGSSQAVSQSSNGEAPPQSSNAKPNKAPVDGKDHVSWMTEAEFLLEKKEYQKALGAFSLAYGLLPSEPGNRTVEIKLALRQAECYLAFNRIKAVKSNLAHAEKLLDPTDSPEILAEVDRLKKLIAAHNSGGNPTQPIVQ